jgi:hypothetical protein
MVEIAQSTARRVLLKLFEEGTTTPSTGETLAITLSKNGGAFANPSAGATNATELSVGWYYVDLSTTDTGTLGDLVVRGTAAGCDPSERLFAVSKATNRGLTALPDAAADAAGGLPISDAGGLDLDTLLARLDAAVTTRQVAIWAAANSTVNLSATTIKTATDVEADTADIQSRIPAALTGDGNIKADTLRVGGTTQTARDLGASVLLSSGTGSGQISLSSGAVTLANGVAHGGTSATLRLGGSSSTPALHVTNSGGDAVRAESTGGNGQGVTLTGHGTGHGLQTTGGATSGSGMNMLSGAGGGYGWRVSGTAGGMYVEGAAGGNGAGITVAAAGSGSGVIISSPGAGHACEINANGNGDAIRFEAAGTGTAFRVQNFGSGKALWVVAPDNVATGTITANITGDITGNLSGSVAGAVGSVTGNVGGDVTGSVGSLAAQAKADVNAEVDSAIETYHLDHLLAATYDPASKPGASDSLLNELVGNDGGVSQFTANALELAPTGGSAPTAAAIADAVLDEVMADHVTAGSLGKALADVLADTNEMQTDWVNGGRLDSLLDAVKAKTDQLTFNDDDVLSVNIAYVNEVEIQGTGVLGDLWRPV